jgi:flagellar assembly protein FliH
MSTKVLKSEKAAGVVSFSIPNIGSSASPLKGVNEFIIPVFEGSLYDTDPDQKELVEFLDEDDVLENAKAKAARIIAEAEEHGEIIQQAASDMAAHTSEVSFETAVVERVDEIRGRLVDTIGQLTSLSAEVNARAETGVVDLAIHIAKKIVGRDVAIDREIVLNHVKVSLGKLHNRSIARVHLNPDDFAFVEEHCQNLGFRGTLNLVEDRTISAGGCLIHTETGDIDARIESQFDEIAHGLFA